MIRKGTIWRGGVALCLAVALMMTGLGCHPAGSSAPAPSTNKPPSGQPKPDLG